MSKLTVSIVIPNWNGEKRLEKNLPEILKVEGVDEIIVVDDASTDKSVEVLRQFPQIKIIQKEQNSGFSSTVNLGVRYAAGDLVLLLNSDAVPEKDCLRYIFDHFENPKVFSVGLSAGGNWSWANFKKGYIWHFESPNKDESCKKHQTLWVSGGSGIFRKDIWERLGGLDEAFDPFYEEDVDLGYRATKEGYINILDFRAGVRHYHEKGVIKSHYSEKKVANTAERNRLLFIWKNVTSKKMMREHILWLLFRLITSPKYGLVLIEAWSLRNKSLGSRVGVKDELTDEEILSRY